MSDFGRTIKDTFRATTDRIPTATAIRKKIVAIRDIVVDKVEDTFHANDSEPAQGGMANFQRPRFGWPSRGSGKCVQMIKCAQATKAQLEDPNYIPQLELTQEATEIISLRFQAPISIIVYVGDMGVGKSKLATVTINALHQTKPSPQLKPFRSGSGARGVTHGVWMWGDPLPHPSGEGSVMLLDCEGMGDINEHLGANLYLFCMIISTSFALVLRPPRIQRAQCDRLYHALLRFEQMKSNHVLPNLWLVPELREYVSDDPKKGETEITKKQWLNLAFNYSGEDKSQRLGTADARELQQRFEKINAMLPKKDVVKLARLPETLTGNSPDLDIWSLLREPDAESYFKSIENLLDQLLSTGGKLMPGATGNQLYIRPCELAAFMTELVKIINSDQKPNPDSLVDKYLLARFVDEIVKEKRAKFDLEILVYANERCKIITEREQLETEEEERELNEQMVNYRKSLTQKRLGEMIRTARYRLLGLDEGKIDKEFRSLEKRQEAAKQLPTIIQKELTYIEKHMDMFTDPEEKIRSARTNMKIINDEARIKALEIAKEKAKADAERTAQEFQKQQRINVAITPPTCKQWLVDTKPCTKCGQDHINTVVHFIERGCVNTLQRSGNWYYYDMSKNEMVCDACRIICVYKPNAVCCSKCYASLEVIRVF